MNRSSPFDCKSGYDGNGEIDIIFYLSTNIGNDIHCVSQFATNISF